MDCDIRTLGSTPATNRMKTKYHSTLSTADAKDGDPTRNHSIRRKGYALALGGFLFTSLFALPAPLAEAQCQQWSVGHGWRFKQGTRTSNGHIVATIVDMNLQQRGTVVTGTAVLRDTYTDKGVAYVLWSTSGTVDGTVKGDAYAVKIEWDNDTTGVYEGTIGPSGKIEGKGWERRTPRTKVRWYSETRMVCAEATAVPPAAPKPIVLKGTGKAKPAATPKSLPVYSSSTTGTGGGFIQLHTPAPVPPPVLSTQGEAGKATRPYIRALPQIVSIPRGESEALTKLVWFAGNDHPNAQLVVAVNGGNERLVDSQRKGSRQVKVKAGRKYVYSLVDAGEPLASVIVQIGQSASAPPERLRGNQTEPRQDGESADEN